MKKFLVMLILMLLPMLGRSQYIDSAKGLLMMPSAEMEESGTFMISNSFLNRSYVENPKHDQYYWGYDTFSYGFGITFWSRLEVDYICTLMIGKWSPYAQVYRAKIMRNQDRHFAVRFQLLKEGEFGLGWMPSVVVGISDPISGSLGDYLHAAVKEDGNGFFNRTYVAVSKHFRTAWGEVGAHAAYQTTVRRYIIPKGPCFGVTWNPVWLNDPDFIISSCRVIAEYDARSVNIGAVASIWKDHFELWGCLQGCRHFNGGLRFKTVLK